MKVKRPTATRNWTQDNNPQSSIYKKWWWGEGNWGRDCLVQFWSLLWKTETAYCKQSSEQCVGRPENEARLKLGVLGFGSWQLPTLPLYFYLLISTSLHNYCIMYDLWHKCRCTATAMMFCVFLMAALHHCFHFLNHILCCWLNSHLFWAAQVWASW